MSAELGAAAVAALFLLIGLRPRQRAFVLSPLLVPAAILGVVGILGLGRLPLIMLAAFGAWGTARVVRQRRRQAAARRRAESVIETCEGLAADLRAGLPPTTALRLAAGRWDELAPVADAARLGADVPERMRALAVLPGAGALRLVAAAWVLAHRSGAGLAGAVALAARTMREDRATARVVATEMAAARATARLLAVLPLGVLLIGRGAGGDPFAFLFGSPGGWICLGGGLGLIVLGLVWLERIAGTVHA